LTSDFWLASCLLTESCLNQTNLNGKWRKKLGLQTGGQPKIWGPRPTQPPLQSPHALDICSCELCWLSSKCVYSRNALSDFCSMNCSVFALSAMFCSGLLTWSADMFITVTHCTITSSGGSRGRIWGNCPPKPLWRPLEWRPFAINAPLFGAHGSRNRFKNTLKINNVFRLVKRQGLRAGLYPSPYRRAWRMLLFRNSSTVSFFCRVRTAQPSQTQSGSQFSGCCCAVWKWSVFYKFILQCLMTALKGKGKAEVKIGMQCGKLITDSRFYKPPKWKWKTSFRDNASAVRKSAVCLHRSFAT